MKTADKLKTGEKGIIQEVDFSSPSSKRILEFGFTPGQEIELVNVSAFDDPLAFSVRGTLIAIRKSEARSIILS
ncbi:feoA domain protein [bacterium BMS3Abin04]|nr:feoA domain protein [bacterium BMS3Abin04]